MKKKKKKNSLMGKGRTQKVNKLIKHRKVDKEFAKT